MAKLVNLGNGRILVGLDKYGRVKDFYFHYAGLENHVSEHLVHKIGVFVEENFSWVSDGGWISEVGLQRDTMVGEVFLTNNNLGIELIFNDVVYNEKNIFIRKVRVKNLFDRRRKIKVYFNQQFNIAQTHVGDTAYFDPRDEVIIHYKGRRVFLINAMVGKKSFSEYSTGLLGIEGRDGTYKDAEDGQLTNNPVEYGQVDSVIAVDVEVGSKKTEDFYYWITVGKSIKKVRQLNNYVLGRHPSAIIKTTTDYWKAWVKNQNFSFYGLGPDIVDLFNKSLINIRTHVSYNGAIIASGDSDLFQFGRDTYSYVWLRDAAFTAIALERAGDFNASKRFFEFCADIITDEGFFMHKYRPDKSLGSSWHPWMRNGKMHLPIQEDETALVIYALWQHYVLSKDLEFIEDVYNSLIKKAAEFMVSYRDAKTGLPKPSYDLWESVYGVSTFTSSCVYGALIAASKFANLLGKTESAKRYETAADEIKRAIMKHLYDGQSGNFYKLISWEDGKPEVDKTIDASSVYGVYKFNILPVNDSKLSKAMKNSHECLEVKTEIGGISRYEGDAYHFRGGNIPGNPWVICTMWFAQYHLSVAQKESDLEPVRKWISWATKLCSKLGVMPEQFDPYSGEFLSATPLAWSHAEFVTTIISYLEKLEELGICKACYPLN